MRDLKHLIYFENLLENADNELVKQAQADGKLAVGYTCYHVPEALLNVGNCFSVRLRAPRTGSLDIATYYMSNYTCEFARALVERGMEGGFQFLDALAGVDACSMMNRAMEHFEILQLNSKPNFFVSHCDIPYKITDYTLDSYVSQMRIHVLDELKTATVWTPPTTPSAPPWPSITRSAASSARSAKCARPITPSSPGTSSMC